MFQKEIRVNGRIRAPEVRLIDHNGSQVGVVATGAAIRMALDVGLDLVEISPTARPPVCRILDYGKYKYQLKKKAHSAKMKQVVVLMKEVKMRPATDEHDFQFKMRHVKRFLEEGNKAKVTVAFRGRELAYTERGRTMMKRIVEELKDKVKVEQPAVMEGRNMVMILSPL